MIRWFLACAMLVGAASWIACARAAEVGCDFANEGVPGHHDIAHSVRPAASGSVALACRRGFIRGPIAEGDYDKVRDFYAKHHPYLTTFFLVSTGGAVDEALKIGRLFRKYLLTAIAPMRFHDGESYLPKAEHLKCEGPRCTCTSACALIWFGAVQRYGVVGLHRPHTDAPAFGNLPLAEAAQVYKRVIAAIVSYLDEMEAPKSVIDAEELTASADIRWVDAYDGLQRSPSFAEWEDASCGRLSTNERETMLELERKTRLTADEKLLLKTLSANNDHRNTCERSLIAHNREQLAPPQKAGANAVQSH